MGMAIKAYGKWQGTMGTVHFPWSECDVFKAEKTDIPVPGNTLNQDGFGKPEQI